MPHTCASILGDGNCLFRVLSKEVTGTQENHKAVHVAIVNIQIMFKCLVKHFLERRLKNVSVWGMGDT